MNDYGIPNYFKYDSMNNTVKININEYSHEEKEFNLDTEAIQCFREINRLYNLCDDDRITYDTNADDEYYTREAIQYVPQKHLNRLKWSLKYITDSREKMKVENQIEILTEVVEEINKIIY